MNQPAPKKTTPTDTPTQELIRPAGPRDLPDLLKFATDMFGGQDLFKTFRGVLEKYGDFVELDLGIRRFTIISNIEIARHVLTDNKNYRKSKPYAEAGHFLGEGLLNSEGDYWKRQRRLAQPAFSKSSVENLAGSMESSLEKMVANWKETAGAPLNLHEEMMGLTLDIIAQTMFHFDVSQIRSTVKEALDFLNEWANNRIASLVSAPVWFPTPDNLRFHYYKAQLDEMVYGLIKKRRSERKSTGSAPADLLTQLMEARDPDTGKQMSDRALRDEVMTIFLAGHETTANGLTFTLYLLARHPAITTRLQAELDEVRQKNNGQAPGWQQLKDLELLRRVVYEGLRLYPPAWIIGRNPEHDDIIENKYFIQGGVDIEIPVYFIHRDARYFEKPEEFYPDHFHPDAEAARPRFAYIPFGAGARMCIGRGFAIQEMMLSLARILSEFNLSIAPDYQLETEPLFTLRPAREVPLVVTPR